MVKVQLRVKPVLLAPAETVTVALPVPLDGDTVSQLHAPETLHEHPLPETKLTFTVVLPPPGAIAPLVGEIDHAQDTGPWSTAMPSAKLDNIPPLETIACAPVVGLILMTLFVPESCLFPSNTSRSPPASMATAMGL